MKTVPSAAASTAATQAFLANRNSNANLSSSAAAAALRSQTTSPFSVGQIQTKRMQRRGSISSNGTAPERPGLARHGSNGSMTERTFRDPSPARPASSHGPYPRQDEPPPVPALPKTYASAVSMPQKAARRAASVEPPERISSPPPRLAGGRGVSLDRGPESYKPNQGGATARLNNMQTVNELEQAGSRGSVNFSRPMSPTNSPPTSPMTGARVKSPLPTNATRVSGLSSREVDRIMTSIQETATRPPKKKKKKVVAKDSAEGSNFATGTTNGSARRAALEATPQLQVSPMTSTPSPSSTGSQPSGVNEATRPKKKKKKAVAVASSQSQETGEGFGSAYPSDTDSVTSERSSTTERNRNHNVRAAGILAKQPSIVREDREAEEQGERQLPAKKANGQVIGSGISLAGTPANTSKIVSKERQHNRSVSHQTSLQGPKPTSLDVPGSARPQSLSPARAAHFSSQPEYETPGGTKHQPPARSVSPAKSALKHSPSRGHSPVGVAVEGEGRRQGFAHSEASDTASNISDDGSRSLAKKKKSVRVSFDDNSVAVGRAASPPMSPDSPVVLSPQTKPKPRSWFDLVREKNQESMMSDSDEDSVIKPTPALPSFGRLRSRNEEQALGSVEEQRPSSAWANDTLRSIDSSTDQIVGGLLSQHAAAKNDEDMKLTGSQSPQDPLPPEVTSVEGSGYQSDEETRFEDEGPEARLLAAKENRLQDSRDDSIKGIASFDVPADDLASEQPSADVPLISLQPATPALGTGGSERTSWLEMPGGFPSASEALESSNNSSAPVAEKHPEITPATVGIAEPEPEAAAAQHELGNLHVGEVAEGLRTQIESQSGDESEDTGGSIYSDAAEDPDDLDGDGFGSINAIVESPAASPPTKMVSTLNIARPSPLPRSESELSEPTSEAGWDRAQAYWSGLSQTRRQQLEQAAAPRALDESEKLKDSTTGLVPIKKPKKKVTKASASGPETNDPTLPPWPDRQYSNDIARAASPKVPPPRSSARDAQAGKPQETHMRSSMRDGPPPKSALRNGSRTDEIQDTHMRSSMRDGPPLKSALRNVDKRNTVQSQPEPRGALQKKNRPVSAVPIVDYNTSQASHAPTHLRAASTGTPVTSLTPVIAKSMNKKATTKPVLGRNDSDSSSSFKKARSSTSKSDPNRYSMKRTMRPSSGDARPQSLATSQSLSGRTSSPTGSMIRRPFSSSGPGGSGMRTSMRDSTDVGKPARTTLRGSVDSKRPKSPSRFGFGKTPKAKAADSKPSRFSSRFGDSSDEEDGLPNLSSRFADSSDDEPTDLTPVRGIPKRIDEGDSTDLEDSSVENAATPSKPKMNGARAPATTKPEGLALATGSLRAVSGDGPTAAMGTGLQAKKVAERDNKKRSFFGSLGSKKRDPPSVRKTDIESTARHDIAMERTKAEKQATTPSKDGLKLGPSSPMADPVSPQPAIVASQTSTAQSSPRSPKLQRRNTPKRLGSANDISWPLGQSPGGTTGDVENRPRTSDGRPQPANAAAGRPDLGMRRSTAQGGNSNVTGAAVPAGASGKKKKFPMLRKALGLRG